MPSPVRLCEGGRDTTPRFFEEAANCSQVRAECSQFVVSIGMIAALDTSEEESFICLLLQSRLAAMGHGLVEWLKVFERGFVAFVCIVSKVFVKSSVACLPSPRTFYFELCGEVFANQGITIDRVITLDANEINFLQAVEGDSP